MENIPHTAGQDKLATAETSENSALNLRPTVGDGGTPAKRASRNATSLPSSGANFLSHALALAGYGYRVFPLTPGGQEPALATDWKEIATSDPARIRELWVDPVTGWEQPYNIGVACGRGLLVVDIDVKDGAPLEQRLAGLQLMLGDLPDTYSVDTPSGGRHVYLNVDPALDIPNSIKSIYRHVDIKSDDGYVVGRGSVRKDGAYKGSGSPADRAEAPPQLVAACMARRKSSPTPSDARVLDDSDVDSESAIERAKAWLRDSAPDHGTFAVACKVKDFGLSEETCLELVDRDWNEARGLGKSTEHVAFRVGNAYRYGQNPVGISAPEAEFEAVEVEDRRTSKSGLAPAADIDALIARFGVTNIGNHRWTNDQRYVVKGLLAPENVGLITGEPNAGKSPLGFDLAAAVAKGAPWLGMKTKPGYVLHLSTEGSGGLMNRIEAQRRTHFSTDGNPPLDVASTSIDLTKSQHVADLIALIQARAESFGLPAALVIIDTLSNALGGSSDSDDAVAKKAVANCKRIARETGAAVLLIHHPTKSQSSSYRGSSVWLFDTDLQIEATIEKGGLRKLTTPRPKDFAPLAPRNYRLRQVQLGNDVEGDPLTSIVVEWVSEAEQEFEPKITGEEEQLLQALRCAQITEAGLNAADFPDNRDIPPEAAQLFVSTTAWKTAASVRQSTPPSSSTFERRFKQLFEADLVNRVDEGKRKGFLWNLPVRQPRQTSSKPLVTN